MVSEMRKLLLFMLIIAAPFILIGAALAQEPTQDEVNDIAKKLNCPTCAGLNLADCRTTTCEQWRNQIYDLLAGGKTEQEVLNFFAAQYGERVLQEPPKRGVALWVWIIPVIGLLGGSVWLVYFLRRWSATRPAVAVAGDGTAVASAENAPNDDLADEYLRRVEQDLQDF